MSALFAPDNELVNSVKLCACSEAFVALSDRHSRLFFKTVHKYLPILVSLGYSRDDILENKNSILFDAILRFDPNKGSKFNTWFCNCTRYYCLNKINKHKKTLVSGAEDQIKKLFNEISIGIFNEKLPPNINFKVILNTLKELKSPMLIKAFKLRYSEGKNLKWQEISNLLKIDISKVHQLHKRGINFLREKIKNKELKVFIDE